MKISSRKHSNPSKLMPRLMGVLISFMFSLMGGHGSCWAGTESQGQGWYGQSPMGWMWYKWQPLPKKKVKKDPEDMVSKESNQTSPAPSAPPSYTDRMKDVQKQFEELQNKAILEPTLENVQTFQRAQTVMMDHSEGFGKMWMLATLLSSQNYREADQPYPMHRKIYREQRDQELDRQIKGMTKVYGLFFVFKKECRYCHDFAPIVRNFIDTYGFDYKAISVDGEPLPEFPDTIADNGTIRILNPEGIYPMLFLVDPNGNQVIPLSRGLVNLDQLRDNLEVILQSFLEQS